MENALVPFDQLTKMAAVMGRNKMFGKTEAELLPLMLIAQAEGKHPAIAVQEYDIIQGQPAIKSKAALARYQMAGGRITWKTRTDTEVEAIFSHQSCDPVTVKWTIKDAERAGLTGKNNWKAYPRQMLSARVIAEGVRASFPACLSGMYTDDEVRDFDLPGQMPERTVTPEPPEPDQAPAEEPPVDLHLSGDAPEGDREACLRLAKELGKSDQWLKTMKATNSGDYSLVRAALEEEKAARDKQA